MEMGVFLAAPLVLGFAVLYAPAKARHWLGFVGSLLLVLFTAWMAGRDSTASVSVPFVLETRWMFSSQNALAAAAFAVSAAPILLLTGVKGRRLQMGFLVLALAGAWGVVFAETYLALFLSWEFVTLSTTVIILADERLQSHRIGLRFIMVHLVAGLSMLFGILLQYNITGSMDIALPASPGVTVLLTLAVGTKAAFLPIHFWIPFTYPKVSPYATLFLAMLTTKVGVVGLVRLLPPMPFIAYMGGAMAIYGALLSLAQGRMREIMSYLIISGLGFMVAAAGFGSGDAALLHMFHHMLYKSLLFMVILISVDLSRSGDLKKQTPKPLWALFLALVGSLAAVGIPPFNGYVSKALVKEAAYGTPVATMLQIGAVLTVMSVVRFLYYTYISPNRERKIWSLDATDEQLGAIWLTAALVILTGVFPLIPSEHASYVYSWPTMWGGLQLIIPAFVILLVFRKWLQPRGSSRGGAVWLRKATWQRPKQWFVRLGQMEMEMTQLPNVQYVVAAFIMIMLMVMLALVTAT